MILVRVPVTILLAKAALASILTSPGSQEYMQLLQEMEAFLAIKLKQLTFIEHLLAAMNSARNLTCYFLTITQQKTGTYFILRMRILRLRKAK